MSFLKQKLSVNARHCYEEFEVTNKILLFMAVLIIKLVFML